MRLSVWSQRAPGQRQRPELARDLLGQAVALEAGEDRPVGHQAGQPPRVEGFAASLSRTDDLAMCVVGTCGAVGIDVERLRPWSELAEMASLVHQMPPRDARGLLELWTRKEALSKAMGTGLPNDVRALSVPERSPAACAWFRQDGWLWIGCPCESGAVASLVVQNEGVDAEGGYDMIEIREKPAIRIWSMDIHC